MRLISLCALLGASSALAAPTELPHSGRMLSAAGDPLTGDITLEFRLYTQASGGTAVWTESDTVRMEDGYYSTLLGDSSTLTALDWTGSSFWLGITPAGGAEFGARSPIGAVPLAMNLSGPTTATVVTTAERDALAPALGQLIYNSTLSTVQVYDGSDWQGIGSNDNEGLGEAKAIVWGYNSVGALGMGDTTIRQFPAVNTTLPPGDVRKMSAAGYSHQTNGAVCALLENQELYCTGYEAHIGDGSSSNSTSYRQVGPGLDWRDVHVGMGLVTCGVTDDNDAYCWGYRIYGGIGDGVNSSTYNRAPSRVIGNISWKMLRPGGRYNNLHRAYLCGVSNTTGSANGYCWGLDSYGELGNGAAAENYTTPAAGLIPNHEWEEIVPGGYHVCGITVAQDLYCWGYNGYGQIGNGNTSNQQSPTLVQGGHKWIDVDVGYNETCGLRTDGVAMCWGYNGYGQLGDGTTSNRVNPVEVVGGKTWKSITVGDYHTCALDQEDRAFCWGYNGTYAIGDGTATQRNAPTPVYGEYRYQAIDAGLQSTVGITR